MEERGEKKRINTNIDHDVLRAMAWERLLKARKVHVKGKIMSLKTLYDSVEKKEVEKERGLCESKENAVRHGKTADNGRVEGRYLRRGSDKQMLRPDEEEQLELVRVELCGIVELCVCVCVCEHWVCVCEHWVVLW